MRKNAASPPAARTEPVVRREDPCAFRVRCTSKRGSLRDRQDFEEMLCLHCAPTFAGLKAASLVSFQKAQYEDFDALLASYAPCFHCVGLRLYRLADGEERALVLFYRPADLRCALLDPTAARLLASCGYASSDVEPALSHLTDRVRAGASFPHEIGIFLGYPPSDVEAFIAHRGKNFTSSGYWKAYGDAEAAETTFRLYADCIEAYAARLRAGATLATLLLRAA